MEDVIVNKVAASGIVVLNLEDFFDSSEVKLFDIGLQLFQGLVLREKDFRGFIKEHDWFSYKDCLVGVYCSVDALIPTWAYMLVGAKLQPYAKKVVFGREAHIQDFVFHDKIQGINIENFRDKKVVVKGCGNIPIPNTAFLEISVLLKPVVKSLMFGEPCSTVPIFKKP